MIGTAPVGVAEALETAGRLFPGAMTLAVAGRPGVAVLLEELADLGEMVGEAVGPRFELPRSPRVCLWAGAGFL